MAGDLKGASLRFSQLVSGHEQAFPHGGAKLEKLGLFRIGHKTADRVLAFDPRLLFKDGEPFVFRLCHFMSFRPVRRSACKIRFAATVASLWMPLAVTRARYGPPRSLSVAMAASRR